MRPILLLTPTWRTVRRLLGTALLAVLAVVVTYATAGIVYAILLAVLLLLLAGCLIRAVRS